MKELKRVFKVFAPGQEEKECEWLNEMSSKGYHFVKLSIPTCYTFEIGEPKDYRYIIDIKIEKGMDEEAYIEKFKNAQYNHLCRYRNYHYFRSENNENIVVRENLKEMSIMYGQESVANVVGIVNIGVFFITVMISLLTEGKINAMSASNLVIGVACLSISKNIKSKIV